MIKHVRVSFVRYAMPCSGFREARDQVLAPRRPIHAPQYLHRQDTLAFKHAVH